MTACWVHVCHVPGWLGLIYSSPPHYRFLLGRPSFYRGGNSTEKGTMIYVPRVTNGIINTS